MAAPVTHFEINAKDGKRAQEFYANLFSWKIRNIPEMNYGLIDTGWKGGIGGGIGQVEENAAPSAIFYVQVEDVQAYLDKAVSLGGKVVQPLVVIPDMVTFGLFADPDGNVIGIVQGPQTPPKEAKPRKKTAKKRTTKTKKPVRRTSKRK